jgi:sigma-B regulation protein RsbU (phosphoserine phosphatase)
MHALVADDDPVTAAALAGSLRRWNFDVTVAHDGASAWTAIRGEPQPSLAIVDWVMPGVDGLELCRRIRLDTRHAHMYVLLLTARDSRADIVTGLDAGADDYLVKPFDAEELRARVHTGARILRLQQSLAEQVAKLQETIANVKQLKGLLPMCSYCKRIRKDEDYWQQVEAYVSDHSDAEFSHGVCPSCLEEVRRDFEGETPLKTSGV